MVASKQKDQQQQKLN